MSKRERLRAAVLAAAPRWYSPRAHLALTSALGLGPMALGLWLLSEPRLWHLGAAAALVALCSAAEHAIHRRVLHVRVPGLGALFDEHTPEHHAIFLTGDMAIEGLDEARLVLIPTSGIAALIAAIGAPTAGLWWAGQGDLAALFLIVCAGYVVSYEWIHLAAHMPETSPLARSAPLRFLRRHHAIHHHPRGMTRCNFNVVFPLADWARGTLATRVSDRPRWRT